jgi:hypothetical protein
MSEEVLDPGHDDVEPLNDNQVIPVSCISLYWI